MSRRFLLFAAFAGIMLLCIFFGKPLYVNLLKMVSNHHTVASRKTELYPAVSARLQPNFDAHGLTRFPSKIRIIAFKNEKLLEVHFRENQDWKLLKSYPFTGFSGLIGPKLREGDKQIPEGIYAIEYLNPNSSFYLSMKINYPNAFDQEMGERDGRTNLGTNIFIHGKSATIGCIPIGDEGIEEVFLLVESAIDSGVEVLIFPHDFRRDPVPPTLNHITWESDLYTTLLNQIPTLP